MHGNINISEKIHDLLAILVASDEETSAAVGQKREYIHVPHLRTFFSLLLKREEGRKEGGERNRETSM